MRKQKFVKIKGNKKMKRTLKRIALVASCLVLVVVSAITLAGCGDSSIHIDTFAELKSAVEKGGQITLDKDINFTAEKKGDLIVVNKDTTINLNGKKIDVDSTAFEEDIFTVDGATLTLKGNGTITGTDCFIVSVNKTENSQVVVKDGTYKVVDSSTVIHAFGGKVTIEGGKFSNTQEAGKNYGSKYLINKQDDAKTTAQIVITGGEFTGFNPAQNEADGPSTSYVPENYKAVETAQGSNVWKVVKK